MGDLVLKTIVFALKAASFVYDFVTFVPYYVLQRPDLVRAKSSRIKAVPLNGNPTDPWRSVDVPASGLTTSMFPECRTLRDLFTRACKLHPGQPCLGTRELLSEADEVQPNGKVFKKVVLGNYYWKTYSEVDGEVTKLANGLLALGLKPKSPVVIFSETRAEWMISAQACFMVNLPIVTLYATLGDEAVVHGINECEASLIITSMDLVAKFQNILPKTTSVTRIVVVGASSQPILDRLGLSVPDGVSITAQVAVMEMGAREENKTLSEAVKGPSPDDIAVIMYTSGSTGLPKGVMISHSNLLCGTSGQTERIDQLGDQDVYVAYLPLAHVLELSAELSCIAKGTRLGYSSPTTLTDKSTKIKKGSQGDVTVLRPTLIAAVPVILDRIYKTVWDKVNTSSLVKKALFHFAYDYKNRHLANGYDTPFCNKIVFKSVKDILGGRVRLMLAGGAPLSGTTQRFMNICFCCPVGQGYGLTETCGAGTVLEFSDRSIERVGAPLISCEILLKDWDEGGYRTSDRPFPRGEIILGGGNITIGYYKNEAKTNEEFYNHNGMRYFRTGDIGEFEADGCLKIIDRKKDLVKLQHGEYVALAQVEVVLGMCPVVDQIVVIARSDKVFVVALIVPNEKELLTLAKKIGLTSTVKEDLCKEEKMAAAVQKEIMAYGLKGKLQRVEIPVKVALFADPWMPDSGLLTDSFKIKRKVVDERFADVINAIYQ